MAVGDSRIIHPRSGWSLVVWIYVFQTAILARADLELTASTLCELCLCGPGPDQMPRDLANCLHLPDDGKRVRLASVPNFVSTLEIGNLSEGVVVMRGAVRLDGHAKLKLIVKNTQNIELEEKSITLLSPLARAHVSMSGADKVLLGARAVTAPKSGHFRLAIADCNLVSIEAKAFDVIDEAVIEAVNTLKLASSAFKPNLPLARSEMNVTLDRVRYVPLFPMETFSSASSITVLHSHVGEVESNAFFGNIVHNVTFVGTSIDRIHSRAFAEWSLLGQLVFDDCNLTSLAEKSLHSAVSTLRISYTSIASISENAVFCTVAKTYLLNNTFQTLSRGAFALKSWNQISMIGNQIMFLDGGALDSIGPAGASAEEAASLVLIDNVVHYANQDALKVSIPAEVQLRVSGNVFFKTCDCSLQQWLLAVSGWPSGNDAHNVTQNSLFPLLFNSSQCQVGKSLRPCFDSNLVSMSGFHHLICSNEKMQQQGGDSVGLDCALNPDEDESERLWDHVQRRFQVQTTKGILLILLLFAVGCSLVVAILTMVRYLAYVVRMKVSGYEKSNNHEWNFTKVEDKECGTHKLDDGDVEMDNAGLDNASHYTDSGLREPNVSGEDPDTANTTLDKNHQLASVDQAPPKPTFYDEMICLLQQKLDDPDNYAVVLDTDKQVVLYQEPQEALQYSSTD